MAVQVFNQPEGVTSRMPTSFVVRGSYPTLFAFRLEASSGAVAATATVTLRASSGGIVHTLTMPISVADTLPPCA